MKAYGHIVAVVTIAIVMPTVMGYQTDGYLNFPRALTKDLLTNITTVQDSLEEEVIDVSESKFVSWYNSHPVLKDWIGTTVLSIEKLIGDPKGSKQRWGFTYVSNIGTEMSVDVGICEVHKVAYGKIKIFADYGLTKLYVPKIYEWIVGGDRTRNVFEFLKLRERYQRPFERALNANEVTLAKNVLFAEVEKVYGMKIDVNVTEREAKP